MELAGLWMLPIEGSARLPTEPTEQRRESMEATEPGRPQTPREPAAEESECPKSEPRE